jgi:uncharacterized membrane protein
MKTFARIVFGLNFLYQGIVGIAMLVAPADLIDFYGGNQQEQTIPFVLAAFRALGIYIFFGGVISGYLAANPGKYPILRRLIGILAGLTLICWAIIYYFNELDFDVYMADVLVQLFILAAVILYPKTRAAEVAGAAK